VLLGLGIAALTGLLNKVKASSKNPEARKPPETPGIILFEIFMLFP
jgi:hypothetical protein